MFRTKPRSATAHAIVSALREIFENDLKSCNARQIRHKRQVLEPGSALITGLEEGTDRTLAARRTGPTTVSCELVSSSKMAPPSLARRGINDDQFNDDQFIARAAQARFDLKREPSCGAPQCGRARTCSDRHVLRTRFEARGPGACLSHAREARLATIRLRRFRPAIR